VASADRRAQPVHQGANAARALYNGLPVGNNAVATIAWSIAITGVFATLAIRKFSHSTAG
jgi:hypothetical protein